MLNRRTLLIIILCLVLTACSPEQVIFTPSAAQTPILTPSPTNQPKPTKVIVPNQLIEPKKNGFSSDTFENLAVATGESELLTATAYYGEATALISYKPYMRDNASLLLTTGYMNSPSETTLSNFPESAAFAPDVDKFSTYWMAMSSGGITKIYHWASLQDGIGQPTHHIAGTVQAGGYLFSEGQLVSAFLILSDQVRVYIYRDSDWVEVELPISLPKGANRVWIKANTQTAFLVFQRNSQISVFQGGPDLSGLHPVGGVRAGADTPVGVDLRGNVLAIAFISNDTEDLMYAEFGEDGHHHAYLIQDVTGVGKINGVAVALTQDQKYALVFWIFEQNYYTNKQGTPTPMNYPFLVRTVVNRQGSPAEVSPRLRQPGGKEDHYLGIVIPSLTSGSEMYAALDVRFERSIGDYDLLFARLYYPNAGYANSVFAMPFAVDGYIKDLLSGHAKGGGSGLSWSSTPFFDGVYID